MNHKTGKPDKSRRRADGIWRMGSVLLALAVWQVLSLCLRQSILLPSPWRVLSRLCAMAGEKAFFLTIFRSLLRISYGYLAGAAGGILLGMAAASHRRVELLLQPWIAAAKAVPVAAVIVIFLIWVSARYLSVVVSILIVLPVVYQNTLTGCRSSGRQMKEMAEIFRLSAPERFRVVTWPALWPYLYAALRTSAGMAWKAGIAAEIIGMPAGSVGRAMYLAKNILDTETLLAWTVAAVAASLVFEKLIMLLLRCLDGMIMSRKPTGKKRSLERGDFESSQNPVIQMKSLEQGGPESSQEPADRKQIKAPTTSHYEDIVLTGISKSYGDRQVFRDQSFVFPAGALSVIRGPSGIGKTTLLRLIMGLEQPDVGRIAGVPERISAVFQEDRLCESLTAVQNVLVGSAAYAGVSVAEEHLREAGLGESLDQPVSAFSAGMKRRTAIVRACLAEYDLLMLDEPFTGLDTDTKDRMRAYIRKYTQGKTVILVTHEAEADSLLLSGTDLQNTIFI